MTLIKKQQAAHSLHIDITVEHMSYEQAVDYITQVLNNAGLQNFRISRPHHPIPGKEKGMKLQLPASLKPGKIADPLPAGSQVAGDASSSVDFSGAAVIAKPDLQDADKIASQICRFIADKRLVRLIINKGRGIQASLPCRFINYRENEQMLTVYHVDESKVYTFHLSEIDDFLLF